VATTVRTSSIPFAAHGAGGVMQGCGSTSRRQRVDSETGDGIVVALSMFFPSGNRRVAVAWCVVVVEDMFV
jgi:hypothetical protein